MCVSSAPGTRAKHLRGTASASEQASGGECVPSEGREGECMRSRVRRCGRQRVWSPDGLDMQVVGAHARALRRTRYVVSRAVGVDRHAPLTTAASTST